MSKAKTTKIRSTKELDKIKERALKDLYPEGRTQITVGMATCGLATGAEKTFAALREELGDTPKIDLSPSGCLGYCQMEPLVTVHRPGKPKLVYSHVTPKKARQIAGRLLREKDGSEDALCRLEEEELIVDRTSHRLRPAARGMKNVPRYEELPFFQKQLKIVLRNCGFINPERIDEYIARGGYQALFKVLDVISPDQVVQEIKDSGLRGRGGGGFPTGLKWELCRKAKGEPKYIICNADEGDPGAYMDRSVLEGDPHSVIEGMLIGAYAIGAREGIIYVRTEYPLARKRLKTAIAQARKYGLLGRGIGGSDFDFNLEIVEGRGAFVCGEETAMIASIEGRPAEPVPRPPFPAQEGLWRKPTVINNVETWANIPVIVARGADWFSSIGTATSKGTKVFSLVGNVRNTGLVEVPMGITLREVIYDVGGGIPGGKKLKVVQTGGPSGGCIPAKLVDLPVDFESLQEAGSIMGSGGMVVMDEDTCLVDIAKFFTSFTKEESCGRCVSCRDGLDALNDVLIGITKGKGKKQDIEFLEEMSRAIVDASLCALGKTAPNPVLTTLLNFRDEYEAHIAEKRCPAGACTALIALKIKPDACTGCGLCLKHCPAGAVSGKTKKPHKIDPKKCTRCRICLDFCKFNAIEVV